MSQAPDPNITALLAQADEDYSRATPDGSWYPAEDGPYTCVIEKVDSGSSSKDGISRVWFKPSYKILHGTYEGRTMTEYYSFTIGAPGDQSMSLGRIKTFVRCINNGAATDRALDDYMIAINSTGTVIEVEKKTRNTNGRTFVNLIPKRLVESK